MQLEQGDQLKFIREKSYKFLKKVGRGGLGATILIQDEQIDELFVCKKYSPQNIADIKIYFPHFISEIKILHSLFHKNVVRVYNYYLYPEQNTGYILMEYIEGLSIDEYIKMNPQKIADIFQQTISAFVYLEKNAVIHRDIRPENILVSKDGLVKVIDFGFGKKIPKIEGEVSKSISLNWRYDVPEEFRESIYNNRTDLYFVGKLFEEVCSDNNITDFQYKRFVEKMIKKKLIQRYESFFALERDLTLKDNANVYFTKGQRSQYKKFVDQLLEMYASFTDSIKYVRDYDLIDRHLASAVKRTMLEDNIENPLLITNIFVSGNYKYYKNKKLSSKCLKEFYTLFNKASPTKRMMILSNMWVRFDSIERSSNERVSEDINPDDIPF